MQKLVGLLLITLLHCYPAISQKQKGSIGSVTSQYRIDENSIIYDETGKQLSFEKYQNLIKKDSNAYRLEQIYNEFGEIAAHKLRFATEEERSARISNQIDLNQRPKAGNIMPLFEMKGLDGKTYRSADLKGKVIVLSFWLKLSRPFWNPQSVKTIDDLLQPYQLKTDFISLGILDESKENLEKFTASQPVPFMPVPNSYGFHKKFAITTTPSFIIIDKSGNVAAFIEGTEPDELKAVLEKATK